MVLTRSSQMQTRNEKARRNEIEHLSPVRKKSVRKESTEKRASYQSLSETSRAKLTKLSNDRMAKASQLRKLKNSLRRKSIISSIVIRESLKTEIKNETMSEEDEEKMKNQLPVNFSLKNKITKDEPVALSEEVDSIVKNVCEEELGIMRDLLRNYIRMVAIGEDKFDICYNPLRAVFKELTPDQFYELVEILRDTDFMVKNADVTRLNKDDKPTIAFNCKVVHKHNIFRKEEKRVLVKATFIGRIELKKMQTPKVLEELEKAPKYRQAMNVRRARQLSEDTRKSISYRPKRKVTDLDRPTILKRTQIAVKEAREERVPQPRPMFSLDNTGKLIVEKKLPAYSLYKGATPATALSASERLKLRKETAARATEKKMILKKLLFDVDLDARQDAASAAPSRYPSYVCLPLSSGVPTVISAPK